MKLTKRISFSAILIALAFLILLLGCVLESITLSAAAIASLCVMVAVAELGYSYALMIYAATSILSFLLLPVKDPLLYFAGFFGYYPILKSLTEKIRSKLNYVIKGVVFSAAYVLILVIGINFFAPEAEIELPIILIAYILLLAVFYLFDLALTKLITFYCRSLRKRLGIDNLLK